MSASAIASLGHKPPGQGLVRMVLGAIVAGIVAFLLFWLMAELVASGRAALTDGPKGRIVDFVRVKKDQNLDIDKPKPEKPDKPEAPPPEVAPEQQDAANPDAGAINIGPMNVASDVAVKSGFGLSASDGEYLPIVKVAPIYPSRAASRGIEGWVLLEFTVTETGAVKDPVVLEAEPQGIFDSAAQKAVLKFKYKPRVDNGKPVQVPHVQHLITFKLEK
ncbi:energy transducer TonB [Sinimarinibacterium sp. CAU 1509]|uniref:energy transducer TonB n=1 Tax=Sinimarinibacterium sp. CAU 1509 TaxID=2562283 RepID=UPI001B7FE95B|nr:energy transducer TonB [Sinimarinibacterium sp. CAU 1509]